MSKPIHRIIHWSVTFFIIWILLSMLWISMGFHYGSYVLGCAMFGLFVGIVHGGVVSRWRLRFLSKNGEHRIQRRTLACWLAIVIIIVGLWVILVYPTITTMMLSEQLLLNIEFWEFTTSFLAAIYAVQIILFSHWEKKYGRIIVSDGLNSTRIYAYPRLEKNTAMTGIESRAQDVAATQ
jgi:hypothetical protein